MSTTIQIEANRSKSTSDILNEIDMENDTAVVAVGVNPTTAIVPVPDDSTTDIVPVTTNNEQPPAEIAVTQAEEVGVQEAEMATTTTDETAKPEEPKKPVNCAVYFRTKTPVDFKSVIAGLNTLVDEATLEFNAEGMTFRGMDPSHIALVDVFVPNHAFEMYECNGVARIGIRTDTMHKVLKDFDNKKDGLKFSYDPESVKGEMIILDNCNGSAVNVKTIEASASSTPLPKLRYDAKVKMNSMVLAKVYKAVGVVSEYIKMETKECASVTFFGRGDEGEITKMFEGGMEGLEELSTHESNVSAMYSLEYLVKAHKAMQALSETTTLEFSSKMPLRVEYKVSDVGRVHYYLAPRVQDD